MGILNNLFKKRSITFGSSGSYSARNTVSTAFEGNPISQACVDIIASCIASLPIDVYRKTSNGREKINNDIQEVIKRPNIDEPRSLFYYTLVRDYFNGNIYLFKSFDRSGKLISLFRLDPSKVQVKRNDMNRKIFIYNEQEYNSDTVLHIPSRYGYNGLIGQSIYTHYRRAFELANTLDEYFESSFKAGFAGGKRLLLDISEILDSTKLSKEERDEIKKLFIDEYTGYLNTEKPLIKHTKAAKYETIDVGSKTNREQQLSENISVAQELICKVFNVPSSFLKGKNEYNGLESLYQILLDFAVRPIVDNIVDGFQTLNKTSDTYIEPNYNALMRMNFGEKIEAYSKQLANGSMTINEARSMENKPSLGPAGDIPNIPANLIPLTMEVVNARLATQKLALAELDRNNQKTGEF